MPVPPHLYSSIFVLQTLSAQLSSSLLFSSLATKSPSITSAKKMKVDTTTPSNMTGHSPTSPASPKSRYSKHIIVRLPRVPLYDSTDSNIKLAVNYVSRPKWYRSGPAELGCSRCQIPRTRYRIPQRGLAEASKCHGCTRWKL